MKTIEKMNDWICNVDAGNHERVKPGQPFRMTEACTVNDRVCQGDFIITVADSIPEDYVPAQNPSLQLVKGNNIGAKHCLDSLDGIEMFVPKDWNNESLNGPYLILSKERTIEHPKHGNIKIASGLSVQCTYQREYDTELKRERRARD